MKSTRTLGNILFWLTLFSPMVAFSVSITIGEAEIFELAGMIKYIWIMWLFIPIGVLSIVIGLKLKNNDQPYKKNLIIAFICIPVLLIFGSYRFIFNEFVSYDNDDIIAVENITGIQLPDEIKSATNYHDDYKESYAKIIDDESKEIFEQELKESQLWKNELSTAINGLLPPYYQYDVVSYDYFVFYNITTDEYNVYPSEGEYECVFIAYDCETQRLFVLSDYTIEVH